MFPPNSEDELERALKISREEEERRIKELEDANKNALFDDSTNLDGPNGEFLACEFRAPMRY